MVHIPNWLRAAIFPPAPTDGTLIVIPEQSSGPVCKLLFAVHVAPPPKAMPERRHHAIVGVPLVWFQFAAVVDIRMITGSAVVPLIAACAVVVCVDPLPNIRTDPGAGLSE